MNIVIHLHYYTKSLLFFVLQQISDFHFNLWAVKRYYCGLVSILVELCGFNQ